MTNILKRRGIPRIPRVKYLLVSDVHLGTKVARARELLEVLKRTPFETLILLGDIFDDLNLRDLDEHQREFIAHIKNIRRKVVWVVGNHDDPFIVRTVSAYWNIRQCEEYEFPMPNKKGERCLAIHGHQFDRFLKENRTVNDFAAKMYLFCQKMDLKHRRISSFARILFARPLARVARQVEEGAVAYGKKNNFYAVFCGHTHDARKKIIDGIHYFNTGSWAEGECHYVTITQDGVVELHAYA